MLVLVSVTAAVVLALSAGSADAQTAPWTADDLTKATSLGDASKCYYGLWQALRLWFFWRRLSYRPKLVRARDRVCVYVSPRG